MKLMKKYLLFFFSFCYLFITTPVFAQKTFTDDFSTNLNKWELINGSWAYWQINNQSLYATISQSRKLSTIVPKNEFWQEMEEYKVDFIFKVFDNTDKNFVIGMRDASNFYDFHFYNNQLIVEDIRNGASLHSVNIPFVLELNKNYLIHILYSKEKIELLIDDKKVFQTDQFWLPPLYGGKFGLKVSTGSVASSRVYFDQIEIKEIDSKNVLFKQNDISWGTEIYDHADDWSEHPDISNWGCALTSIAMLLRAYGYYSLPNDNKLNPSSLNQWLLEQDDGYIANGLVNWLAISRLSKILSDESNNELPKLEFNYFKSNEEETLLNLQENLSIGVGQIATDGKHFFLVNKYLSELHEFVIKDPLYEQELLSQKSEPIESLRIFTPSMTDLSYLMIVLPKEFSFILNNETGNILETINFTEQIETIDETMGSEYQIIYYPKPNTALFNLIINSNVFNQELIDQIQIFLYQSNGNVQQIKLNDLINDLQNYNNIRQLNLHINYMKDAESIVELNFEEKTIDEQKQNKLNELANWAQESFTDGKLSFYLFYQLNLLIDSLRDHLSYFFLLEKFLEFHQL